MKIFAAFMTNLMSKNLDLLEPHNLIEPGVFTFGDLLRYCQEKVTCPYFTVRRMVGLLLPSLKIYCADASYSVAILQRYNLQLSLSPGSQDCRTSFKGAIERLHCCF